MIKLFWNTHNQNKPNNQSSEKEARDYLWGTYHKNNSHKWIFEILNKIKFKYIENYKELENEDVLIIVDSNVEKKNTRPPTKLIIISKSTD